jgi:metal-responsive CopG/Arc/MetJ family transcriptional regulator
MSKVIKVTVDNELAEAIDNICKAGGIGRDSFMKLAIDNYVNLLATSYMTALKKAEEEEKSQQP